MSIRIVIHTGLLWSVYIDSDTYIQDCYGVSIWIVIYTGLLWSVYMDSDTYRIVMECTNFSCTFRQQ